MHSLCSSSEYHSNPDWGRESVLNFIDEICMLKNVRDCDHAAEGETNDTDDRAFEEVPSKPHVAENHN